jgi:RNA polymerase sigma-70 factor, ECF subfamily
VSLHLYSDIQPRLLHYLPALAGQDAEDIASKPGSRSPATCRLHRDLRRFRGWVATIARHRALDHLRKTTRRPRALALPAEDLAAPASRRRHRPRRPGRRRHRRRPDRHLAPDQAEAVLLRAVLGLDAATSGHVLGKRPGAVRTAAHRGLKTLHKRLDADPGRHR